MKAGAAATVIYNNESANNLMMNLADYEYKNPAVLIPMISAGSILAASEKDETTGLYGGKMVVANQGPHRDGRPRAALCRATSPPGAFPATST